MDLQIPSKSTKSQSALIMILIFTALMINLDLRPQNSAPASLKTAEMDQVYVTLFGFLNNKNPPVVCNNNNPILKISGDDYIIKDINYVNNSILLANSEVFDEENSRPTPLHNFSSSGIPFSYSPTFAELYFFYNCTFVDEFATYSIDCASNVSHHSFAVFHSELLKKENYSVEWCQAVVNAPVSTSDISKLVEMSYMDVLKKGFVLEWDGYD